MPYCSDCGKQFGASGVLDLDFRSYCDACTRAKKQEEAREERERRHQEDEERRHQERLQADDERFRRQQDLEEEHRREEEMRQFDEEARAEEREREREERERDLEYEREERAARAAAQREEASENARLAKIAHDVAVACRSSQRKLAAGRAAEALEDAERALDHDPNDETALSCAYFAAKSASRDAMASEHFLDRWVARFVVRTQGRGQPDSSTSDMLITEAAGATLAGDRLIRSLVDAYRSAPLSLRNSLAKIGRTELFGAWLDVRLKRYFAERLGFPIESLLDAIAALPDGPARISILAGHLVEHVSFHAPIAEWLRANGYARDAAIYVRTCAAGPGVLSGFNRGFAEWLIANGYTEDVGSYVHNCATGPNAPAGFDVGFSDWLVANGFLRDANDYLRRRAAGCDAGTRVGTLIPLGIEICRRMKAQTSDWMSMLSADLATLPLANISASALKSSLLSSESKDDVIKAMIAHVNNVISGPEKYRLGAGLPQAKAGVTSVYSVKSGKHLERPLLDLNAPLVGGVCGLAVWLLPGGTFADGVGWGVLATGIAWIWKLVYAYRKSEVSNSIVGKYCHDYGMVLERLGADKRVTSALTSKVPNANPKASLLTALGTVGMLTAIICTSNSCQESRKVAQANEQHARAQVDAQAQAKVAAVQKQAELELANRRNSEQAADAQRKVKWETEARGRRDAALAQAKKVREQTLANARGAVQQGMLQAREVTRQSMAEAQNSSRAEQMAAQARHRLAEQAAQRMPAMQAAVQAAFQQDQAAAAANYQRVAAAVQAQQRQTELDIATAMRKAEAEAKAAFAQAEAEAQERYQFEREHGPSQASAAANVVATAAPNPRGPNPPAPIQELAVTSNPQMVADNQSGCKVWKPNLQLGESVSWSGACTDGYASGNGVARWSSGGVESFVYEGTFRSGLLQGKGVMNTAGGDRYEGDYKDGKRDGKGTYATANGQRYTGEFRENKKHGAGIATDSNGASVQVKFVDGQQVN